jgi:S-adenosylmethionine hydrolase
MPTARFWSHFGFAALVVAMTASLSAFSSATAAPPIIGLFTDFGGDDPYVAQIKGVILSIEPNARILDLLHTAEPFDITEGAFLLDQAAEEFPAGTIFVAVIDPGVGTDRAPILLETGKEKYYLGPDNGLFTFVIAREGFSRAWKLDRPDYFRPGAVSHTFHGRDIFGPVAAHLASGTSPDRTGTPLDEKSLTLLPVKGPAFSSGTIATQVLHIDHFGNVILNLPEDSDEAQKLKEGDLVKIIVGHESYSGPLVRTYADIGKGRLLLVYGGSGLLEIGVNQGSAAHMLKIEPGATVYLRP